MKQICNYCGAPIQADADKCPYCRISYDRPVKTIDATNFLFDVHLHNETIRMYISEIQSMPIIHSARNVEGKVISAEILPPRRKITLIEE